MITKIVCVICIIVLIVSAILIFTRTKKSAFRFAAAALFFLALGLMKEFKSLPLQFSSQEEAIQQLFDGKVVDVMEGKDSSLVITAGGTVTEGPQFINNYLIKTNDGYRAATFFEKRDRTILMDNGMFVSVCLIEGTQDYYAYGFYPEPVGQETTITDTNGTVFKTITMKMGETSNIVFAYAYVETVGDNYGVNVEYKT